MLNNFYSFSEFDQNQDFEDYEEDQIVSDSSSSDDESFYLKNKSKKLVHMNVSIDTEFTESETLSLQIHCTFTFHNQDYEFKIIIINEKYLEYVLEDSSIFLDSFFDDIYIFFDSFTSESDVLFFKYILKLIVEIKNIISLDSLHNYHFLIYLFFYYSAKDLVISLGWLNLKELILKKELKDLDTKVYLSKEERSYIRQKRSISGMGFLDYNYHGHFSSLKIIFKDLFGLSNRGLKDLIHSVGLGGEFSSIKQSMDIFKARMNFALKMYQKKREFLVYAMADTIVLLQIIERKISTCNVLLKDVYFIDIEKCSFNIHNFPLTVGRLVYKIWEKYLNYVIFKDDPFLKLAYVKSGILSDNYDSYHEAKESFTYLSQKIKSLSELKSKVF